MNGKKNYSQIYDDWDNVVRKRKIFLSNPVFIKGLGLAPIVIAATNLENGLILSIAVFLLLTPTRIVTSFITRRMSVPLKTFFYPLVSALIFGCVYYYMYLMFGTKVLALGVYLPILVVDPLIVKNFEKTRKESFIYSIINGLRNTFGFITACLIVSIVREFLAFGTIGGIIISPHHMLPMAQYSFGGFLIVALICGGWKMLVNMYRYKVEVEAMHNERINESNK